MIAQASDELKHAIRQLHRVKDAAYRNAWKKRGEVMSIMANIARKVDRLDYVTGGAQETLDESLVDTAIDLLVYSIKYQTYLADHDEAVATTVYRGTLPIPPYSDGPVGFEVLLDRLDMTAPDTEIVPATQRILLAFRDLEECFQDTLAPLGRRAARAMALTDATTVLIGSLTREAPERYRNFLTTYSGGAG